MVTVVEMAEVEGAEGLGVEDTSGNVDGGIADCAHDKEGRERRVRMTGTTERYIGFVVRVLRGTPSYLSSRAAEKGVGKHNQISPEAHCRLLLPLVNFENHKFDAHELMYIVIKKR